MAVDNDGVDEVITVFQPAAIEERAMIKESEINVKHIKAFNIRRKWRVSGSECLLWNRSYHAGHKCVPGN